MSCVQYFWMILSFLKSEGNSIEYFKLSFCLNLNIWLHNRNLYSVVFSSVVFCDCQLPLFRTFYGRGPCVSQFSSINGSRFTPIFLSWKVLFLFTKNATRNTWKCAVFLCLKEINSVQFFYLHSRQIQVLSEIGRIESWKCESEKYLFLRPHINQF